MAVDSTVQDRFFIVYAVFYWIGISTLLPWNFFLAVNNYWMYKLRDVGNATVEVSDFSSDGEPIAHQKMSALQLSWGPYLSMSAMIPNVICLLLNVLFGSRSRPEPRIYISIVVIILVFIYSTVMTSVNTDSYQMVFLIVTLITVAIINVMTAIFQGGFTIIAGRFPPRYMGAMVQGQALGGIIAAGINVLMLGIGLDDINAALYDFVIATIWMCTALAAFGLITTTKFYKHYTADDYFIPPEDDQTKEQPGNPEAENLLKSREDPALQGQPPTSETPVASRFVRSTTVQNLMFILKTIWPWIASVFICFLVTLSVFPSITTLVQSKQKDTDWAKIYFIPVGCFLLFNIGDYCGRILSSLLQWPDNKTPFGGYWVMLMSIIRVAFIPMFLFCNASPGNRSVSKVLFDSDAIYLALMILFSLSNGYIGGVAMQFAPKIFSAGKDQGTAAAMMVFFLVFGLAIGSALSGLIVKLL